MKIFIFYFIILILILKCNIFVESACPCTPMKIEDKYCNSNWVAHVLVLNRANNKSFRYKVKVLKIYKDIRGNKKEINYLFSPPVNFCGVSLENGKEYLIGGIYGFNLNKIISLCRINLKWNNVSKKLKKALNNGELDKYCK
ncbi:hypothetical protein ACQ4LE_008582 [Meloidogyne hapla]